MKLRITEPGWEGFTGLLGHTEFVDGVSVDDVGRGDAQNLSAIVRIEDEKGHNPSEAQAIIDGYQNQAPVVVVEKVKPVVATAHTRAELEAIADADGIKGLRLIGDALGVKGNSIVDLMNDILAAEAKAAAAAAAASDAAKE